KIKNKSKITEYRTYYSNKRRKESNIVKLSENIRRRINVFLSSNKITKKNKTFDIVGCTPQFLKEYLEKKFLEGMSWDNYGFYGWHIDHIIPLCMAKTEEEVLKLCHYTNLQPLWGHDNFKKGGKIL
ncbi:HNH endonuclease, partial [bacterium]|nr:HNH endonuclease [bacterium]